MVYAIADHDRPFIDSHALPFRVAVLLGVCHGPIKKPRECEADNAHMLGVILLGGCHGRRLRDSSRNCLPTYGLPVIT